MKNNKQKIINDYRLISKQLNDLGHPMNHASVRNKTIKIMKKIAKVFCQEYDIPITKQKLETLAISPQFQTALFETFQKNYKPNKN